MRLVEVLTKTHKQHGDRYWRKPSPHNIYTAEQVLAQDWEILEHEDVQFHYLKVNLLNLTRGGV